VLDLADVLESARLVDTRPSHSSELLFAKEMQIAALEVIESVRHRSEMRIYSSRMSPLRDQPKRLEYWNILRGLLSPTIATRGSAVNLRAKTHGLASGCRSCRELKRVAAVVLGVAARAWARSTPSPAGGSSAMSLLKTPSWLGFGCGRGFQGLWSDLATDGYGSDCELMPFSTKRIICSPQ